MAAANKNVNVDKSLSVEENEKIILCVGMCVLDFIHVCSTFPEEDSDKRSKYGRWQRGGNASNNCSVLTQFGQNCEFLGVLSNTKMFKFVIEDMVDQNIKIPHCVYVDCDAPISSVLLNESTGSRTIIHSNPNLPIFKFSDFRKVNLSAYKWIHFEGRNPEETIKMMEHISDWNAKSSDLNKIKISLDLEKIRMEHFELVKYSDVVFLGKDLAVHLGSTDMKSAVYNIRRLTRSGYTIICPWGSDGAAALDADDNFVSTPSHPPLQVVDTLGAGDTFAATAIFALSQNQSVEYAIQLASKIAGAKCGFYGYDKIREVFKTLN